jgi:hypothetical protein
MISLFRQWQVIPEDFMDRSPMCDVSAWPTLGAPQRNNYRVSPTMVDMRRPLRQRREVLIEALPQHLLIDLARAALVVVDMQNDFCAPESYVAGTRRERGYRDQQRLPGGGLPHLQDRRGSRRHDLGPRRRNGIAVRRASEDDFA